LHSSEKHAVSPRYDRASISRVAENVQPYGVDLFISGMEGASNLALLHANDIGIVVNCAVNLDLDFVDQPLSPPGQAVAYGYSPIRYYKLGLIDGDGNPDTMLLAGYYLLKGALEQVLPDKPSYPMRGGRNVLLNCRAGRSRSAILASLFLWQTEPARFPSLEAALDQVRQRRELHPDEWFETPKPVLIAAARRAGAWAGMIEASGH